MIDNNSYVAIDSIGIHGQSDSDGLFCHSDSGQGNWYYKEEIVKNTTNQSDSIKAFVSITMSNNTENLLRTNKSTTGGQAYCVADDDGERVYVVIGKSQ